MADPDRPEPGPNQTEVNRRQGVVNALQGDFNADLTAVPGHSVSLDAVQKAAENLHSLVVTTRRRSRFYTGLLFIVLALTIVALIRTGQNADSRNSANAADIRKTKIAAHVQCLRGNDGRQRIRQFNADTLFIISTVQQPLPVPIPGSELEAAIKRIADRGKQILPTQDCDVVAPLPTDMSVSERAQIPTPEPIPPLGP